MRVSPVGYSEKTLDDVLKEAKRSAECSHNHPEGIKGAQSTAAAIFLALNGKSKEDIKDYLEIQFDYQFELLDKIRPDYEYDISCQGTCPPAFQAFFESNDFEHAIRLAVSLGGDADTLGAITGSVAEAFYGGIPEHIYNKVLTYLSKHQLKVLQEFSNKYNRE
jgi:ADP-ribosylglycohydrolase